MTETKSEPEGARRIVYVTTEVVETLSDSPTQISEIRENLSVEASRQTVYRVLDALSDKQKVQKVNADGEVDENGRSWILAD